MTTLPDSLPITDSLADNVRDMVFEFLTSGQAPGRLSQQEMDTIIRKLPRLDEKQVIALGHAESVCPICFVPLTALLAEEETAIAMDSPAHPTEELGVTRLAESFQCNHLFCRRDISRWVMDGHDTCPTCRRPLLERGGERTSQRPDIVPPDVQDAYDPSQLNTLLERLREGEVLELPGLSTFPTFFPGPRRAPQDDRNEYSSMYS
ncbi:hypothetical protein F5880DRAFT_1514502 [Lentinula raphanica]|nr:hypothetical protein F5880DRAFT_1514502 [Lentinula raphanica]